MEERMRSLEDQVSRLRYDVSESTRATRELRDDLRTESRERRSDLWTILYSTSMATIVILVWQVAGCSTLENRQDRFNSTLTDLRIAVDKASISAQACENGVERSDAIHQEMTERYHRLYEKVSEVRISVAKLANCRDADVARPPAQP